MNELKIDHEIKMIQYFCPLLYVRRSIQLNRKNSCSFGHSFSEMQAYFSDNNSYTPICFEEPLILDCVILHFKVVNLLDYSLLHSLVISITL